MLTKVIIEKSRREQFLLKKLSYIIYMYFYSIIKKITYFIIILLLMYYFALQTNIFIKKVKILNREKHNSIVSCTTRDTSP